MDPRKVAHSNLFRPFEDIDGQRVSYGSQETQIAAAAAADDADDACAHTLKVRSAPSPKSSCSGASDTARDDLAFLSAGVRQHPGRATRTPAEASAPAQHSSEKPRLSYTALIANAILSSRDRRLNLSSIYSWIEERYPFYGRQDRRAARGWRNSVRHNLSLNECFVKVGRCEDGKGNYWGIHEPHVEAFERGDFRLNLGSRRRRRPAGFRDPELTVERTSGPMDACGWHFRGLCCCAYTTPPHVCLLCSCGREAMRWAETPARSWGWVVPGLSLCHGCLVRNIATSALTHPSLYCSV
ncbi:unnamed protein product [Lampetra fluviatilis]